MKGYFAVGVYQPKNTVNIGTLWRSAYILGASYIFTIGSRYKKQASDTCKTTQRIPFFEYDCFEHFTNNRPKDCLLVGVELSERAESIESFSHPERAIYLLGAEDNGIPDKILSKCNRVIKLRGEKSMNVSVAGSIVLYHRGL